jgi:hypothetical protein
MPGRDLLSKSLPREDRKANLFHRQAIIIKRNMLEECGAGCAHPG